MALLFDRVPDLLAIGKKPEIILRHFSRAENDDRGTLFVTMTPEDRDHMLELSRRIHRESEPPRLAFWITELNN